MIFKEQPKDFNKKVDVVGCYLEHNSKFLLLHRQEHKSQGGKWGVVAGKVEQDEKLHDAMVREMEEETGVLIKKENLDYFTKVYVRYSDVDFIYHMFCAKLKILPDIKIGYDEHKDFKWASVQEALEMNLVDDLDECIKMLYYAV